MRLRSFHFLLLTAALSSCAEHAPVVDPHPIAPLPPAIAPVDGGTPPTVALLEPIDAGVDAGAEVAMSPENEIIDQRTWLTARGVSEKDGAILQDAGGCEEVVVGTNHEPALMCSTMEDVTRKTAKFPMDRMLEHRTVNVVRGNKLVKVLDVLVTLEQLDKVISTQPNIVDLALHMAPDGLSAKLDEHTDFAGARCAEARAENHRGLPMGAPKPPPRQNSDPGATGF